MMVALGVVFKTSVIAVELAARRPAVTAAGLAAHRPPATVVELAARHPAVTVAGLAAHHPAVTRLVSNQFRAGLVRLRLQLLPMRARRFGLWYQTTQVLPGPDSGLSGGSRAGPGGSGDG